MKTTNKKTKPKRIASAAARLASNPVANAVMKPMADAGAFITAQQASAVLNLPLYYFLNTAKREQLGVPHYCISRMVRYRLQELRKWQLRMAYHLQSAEQLAAPGALAEGGVDA